MKTNSKILGLKDTFEQTLKLISLYKKSGLSLPFGLKGNLGEFSVVMELVKRFSEAKIEYYGGSFPEYDILFNGKKIQVKTQIKTPPEKFKGGEWDFESCPTVKKSILDEKKCDALVLVILYPNEDFSKIIKTNMYVFSQDDFRYFSTKCCWSGKSKGDYTIVNILNVKGQAPLKLKAKIDFYNTPKYLTIFKNAKDNWDKIKV